MKLVLDRRKGLLFKYLRCWLILLLWLDWKYKKIKCSLGSKYMYSALNNGLMRLRRFDTALISSCIRLRHHIFRVGKKSKGRFVFSWKTVAVCKKISVTPSQLNLKLLDCSLCERCKLQDKFLNVQHSPLPDNIPNTLQVLYNCILSIHNKGSILP